MLDKISDAIRSPKSALAAVVGAIGVVAVLGGKPDNGSSEAQQDANSNAQQGVPDVESTSVTEPEERPFLVIVDDWEKEIPELDGVRDASNTLEKPEFAPRELTTREAFTSFAIELRSLRLNFIVP